jgi:hypothetical protein
MKGDKAGHALEQATKAAIALDIPAALEVLLSGKVTNFTQELNAFYQLEPSVFSIQFNRLM